MPKFTKKKKKEEKTPADHPMECPGNVVSLEGLPAPRNFFILDLNLSGISLYENFKECIAHHRWWTFYNSKRIFEYSCPESRSWVLPEDGTYLLYVRFGTNMMCLVGIASKSWFQAVLLNGRVFEFSDNRDKEVSNKISKYIQMDEGSEWARVEFNLSGRYMQTLWDTPLGPKHFRNACTDFYGYINGVISLPEDRIRCCITIIVMHIWDTAHNNDVMDTVLNTFRPGYAESYYLGKEPCPLMRKWKKVCVATVTAINDKVSYDPIKGTSFQCIPEVMQSSRQFYQGAARHTKFNVSDLPIRMIGGDDERSEHTGYADDGRFERVQYPSWIMKRFVRGGDSAGRNPSGCLQSSSSSALPIQKPGLEMSWEKEDSAAVAKDRTIDKWKWDETGASDQVGHNDLDKCAPSECSLGSRDMHQFWRGSGPAKFYVENLTSVDPCKCSEDAKPSEGGVQNNDPWASKLTSTKGQEQESYPWVGRMTSFAGAEGNYVGWNTPEEATFCSGAVKWEAATYGEAQQCDP